MSGTVTARRARADISFAGIDISTSISKYLISMSYTDNEEDETDDLQISLADREDIWLENWLNDAIDASADAEEGQASSASAVTWNIGDEVIANGSPQYSSHGVGTPGSPVTNYRGKITDLNFKDGVSYPICVGVLGWFSEEQITRTDEASSSLSISKGFKIEAAIIRENWTEEGKKERLELGEFELDEISAQGPPSTISIKSSSLPYSSSIRQTKKSKSWEKYSLRGIGNEIAEKNGMSLLFLSEKNPEYERVEQYKQSDIAFLKKLCLDAGCSLKVSDNKIVIIDKEQFEGNPTVKTITRGKKGGYSKYKLSTSNTNKYSSCRVSYTAPDGSVIQAIAKRENAKNVSNGSDNNQKLEITQKVSNEAEALALAEKMLKYYNKFEKTASFTFPGDPSLVAGLTVHLKEWGAWSGKYIISQSKHTVSRSGYTTQITLRKVD